MSKVAKWIFPVAGGVKGVVGTALAVVGFATGNTGLILSGVSMVAGAGKKTQGQARQSSILSLTLGETQREAAIGLVCTGGSLVDVFNFGGQYGTDKVTRCVALADHAIDGMVGFYIYDTYYPWVGEGLQAAFSNKLSFHFRQATADGHAPPQHVLENGGWIATDRMVGITHIWIDWYVDEKVWPQGHPAIRFVFRGLRVYDPRFDPALGYTGPNPQTWADRSTHKFSRNAKVLRYAYTRGIYAEGHHGDPNYLLIGRGLTAEEAPPERVIADANLCDEIVDGVARYCADGVISASQQFIEVDGMFAAAMAGQIVQREGSVDVEAGQAKAVVATITDDDLVVGEPVSFSRFLPDNDGGRINTVIGRYIEPSLGFKDQSAPVRRSLTDIQTDGGPREQTLSLPLVTEVKQVDRVIEIQRLMARLERRASIVLPPKFAGLEEGDWIAWQSNRRHNGATVRYQVQAYRQPETWRMYLTLREIASSVFGVPDPVEDFVTPPPPPVPIDALALTGVTAEAITLPGDSSAVPAIRFRWDAPVDAAVLAIRAEVRRVGETETAPTRTEQVNDGVMVATNGVGPDQSLQARLVPIGDPSRPVLPSAWITVSTAGLVAGDVSSSGPTILAIRTEIDALADQQASETIIREEQIDSLRVQTATRPNLLINATGAGGMQGLTRFGSRDVVAYPAAPDGPQWAANTSSGSGLSFGARWAPIAVKADFPYSLQAELGGFGMTGGQVRAVGVFKNSSGGVTGYIVATAFYDAFAGGYVLRKTENVLAPIGSATVEMQIDVDGGSFTSSGSASWRRVKLEQNASCTQWTDDATARDLYAETSITRLGVLDLEAQNALARLILVAAASGGVPARIGLSSSSLGSAITFDAPFIYWGANTVFDDATDTLVTVVGSNVRVLAFGAPFGADGNLLEWWGPASTSMGAMTTANGLNGRMTTAPYVFDNVIGVARFQPEADASLRIGTRTSAGQVTTTTVTIAPVGATGTVTYSWAQIGGSEEWVITAPSAGATAFRVNVSTPGEQKRATFACRVSDAGTGKTATVIVGAVAIYNV